MPRPGKITFYRDRNKQWRWRITAANGRKLANSGEGYRRLCDCRAALDIVTLDVRHWEDEETER